MTATLDAVKAAHTYAIDKMHSEVAFQVRHLLTKVRGQFTELAGTVSGTIDGAPAAAAVRQEARCVFPD